MLQGRMRPWQERRGLPGSAQGAELPPRARARNRSDRVRGVGARRRQHLPIRPGDPEADPPRDAAGRAAPRGPRGQVRAVERGRMEALPRRAGRGREAGREGLHEEGRARVRLRLLHVPLRASGGDGRAAAPQDARHERARGDRQEQRERQPHRVRPRRERLQDLRAQAREGRVLEGVPVGSASAVRPRVPLLEADRRPRGGRGRARREGGRDRRLLGRHVRGQEARRRLAHPRREGEEPVQVRNRAEPLRPAT